MNSVEMIGLPDRPINYFCHGRLLRCVRAMVPWCHGAMVPFYRNVILHVHTLSLCPILLFNPKCPFVCRSVGWVIFFVDEFGILGGCGGNC